MRPLSFLAAVAGCLATLPLLLSPAPSQAAEQRFYSVGTYTSGTGPYIYFGTVAGMLRRVTDEIDLTVEATGGTNENLDLLRRGEIQIGVASPQRLYAARHAIGDYAERQTDAYILWQFLSTGGLLFTKADSDIESFHDLKGKRVVVGPAGSANELKNAAYLEAYGYQRVPDTASDFTDVTVMRMNFSEAANALAENVVDAVIITQQAPDASMAELAMSQDVRAIPLDEDMFDEILAVYPQLWPTVIPANTYRGQTKPLRTLGDPNYVIATGELSDDDAYLLTKLYVEELLPMVADNLAFIRPYVEEPTLLTAAFVVPPHPGAARYFAERGWAVEEVPFSAE